MSLLTGWASAFDGATDSHTEEQKYQLGTRALDKNGNEYVYLLGLASTTANMLVTFDEEFATTLAIAGGVGTCAVAQAATVADEYGWYMIWGKCTVIANAATADNKALCVTASAGWVDDAQVAGDLIHGAFSRGAASAQEDEITAQITYPYIDDVTES